MTFRSTEPRSDRLSLALSPKERRQITEWAHAHGLSVSAYIRFRALENPIPREVG